jgi:hypothetical protein
MAEDLMCWWLAAVLCLARQGCRVAVFEATNYAFPRYGETLPPEMNPFCEASVFAVVFTGEIV